MTRVLVTGSDGFLGRNLITRLRLVGGVEVMGVDVHSPRLELDEALKQSDVIFHLAGVNRPTDPGEFSKVNRDLTREICGKLTEWKRSSKIIFSSSTQAALDNPYGVSKREAEDALLKFGECPLSTL